MKDITEDFDDIDDLRLGNVGKELDIDNKDVDDKATTAMAVRLLRATDYDDGDTITTDDGKKFKVSKARAIAIRNVIGPGSDLKSMDKGRLDNMLKKSENFEKVMKGKSREEVEQILGAMLGAVDKAEPSKYI